MATRASKEEREVYYRATPYEGARYTNVSWPSAEIDRIHNVDLRLALQLADIVQALGVLEYPQHGGFPGNIRAVSRGSSPAEVYSSFPDDIMVRLERWHDENHSDFGADA